MIRGKTLLGEVIEQADDSAEIAARFHVLPMPDQESRRTVNQFIPKDWLVIQWTVSGHSDPDSVTFTPMRDNPVGFDEPGHSRALSDQSSQVITGWFHYLGRMTGGIPEEGFWIEARPNRVSGWSRLQTDQHQYQRQYVCEADGEAQRLHLY